MTSTPRPAAPPEVRTAAGRDALRFLSPDWSPSDAWRDAILAIEAEAEAAAEAARREARVRTALEMARDWQDFDSPLGIETLHEELTAALENP